MHNPPRTEKKKRVKRFLSDEKILEESTTIVCDLARCLWLHETRIVSIHPISADECGIDADKKASPAGGARNAFFG